MEVLCTIPCNEGAYCRMRRHSTRFGLTLIRGRGSSARGSSASTIALASLSVHHSYEGAGCSVQMQLPPFLHCGYVTSYDQGMHVSDSKASSLAQLPSGYLCRLRDTALSNRPSQCHSSRPSCLRGCIEEQHSRCIFHLYPVAA